MIANDKCKTFQDTEVDVIYQVVHVKAKLIREFLYSALLQISTLEYISARIMVFKLSYSRDGNIL